MSDGATTGRNAVPPTWDAFDRDARPKLRARLAYASGYGIDPDDIVQESLIAAHEHFLVLDATAVMIAWCQTDATWRIVRALTRKAGRFERPHDNPEAMAERAGFAVGPEDEAVERADRDRVLARLSPADQEVLALYFADMTPQDLAAALGVSGHTARQRLHRARDRYAEEMRRGREHAPLLPLWLRRRIPARVYPDLASPVSPALAASVALSVVAAFTASQPSAAATNGDVRVRPRALDNSRAGHEPRSVAGSGPAVPRMSPLTGTASAGAGAPDPGLAAQQQQTVAVVVATPSVPPCVGVCLDKQRGDQIVVKPLGPYAPAISQYVTPVCVYAPDNVVIECRPGQDPDAWILKDVPPIPSRSGGTP